MRVLERASEAAFCIGFAICEAYRSAYLGRVDGDGEVGDMGAEVVCEGKDPPLHSGVRAWYFWGGCCWCWCCTWNGDGDWAWPWLWIENVGNDTGEQWAFSFMSGLCRSSEHEGEPIDHGGVAMLELRGPRGEGRAGM